MTLLSRFCVCPTAALYCVLLYSFVCFEVFAILKKITVFWYVTP